MAVASEVAILFLSLALIVLFAPPNNPFIIFLFILLSSVFIYRFISLRIRKKYSLLVSIFIGTLLGILALGVFDIINMALLLSLIIGLAILIQ